MASTWITVSNGLVTNKVLISLGDAVAQLPSHDPWIDVTGMVPMPDVGDFENGDGTYSAGTSLSEAQAIKIASLRNTCALDIEAGFTQGQLRDEFGEPWNHLYRCKITDQLNMAKIAVRLMNPSPNWSRTTWCVPCDNNGNIIGAWDMKDHNAEQIANIIICCDIHINDRQWQLKDYVEQVLAATTISAVNAITWVYEPR